MAADLAQFAARMYPELVPFLGIDAVGDEWLVRIHPADEEVRLTAHGASHLLLSARTNGGGPGYHAFLVRAMDALSERRGLRWRSDDGEFSDETGYFDHRDFARLQAEMAGWLRSVARSIVDGEAFGGPWLLSMPLGTPVPAGLGDVAISPMGTFSHEWLEDVAAMDDLSIRRAAADYFPWWTQDRTAAVRNVGRVLLFGSPWHPPADAQERALAELALECAAPGDGAASSADLNELRDLLQITPDEARPPRADGFGYRRGPVRFTRSPGWSFVLPGYFYCEENEESVTYGFGAREVTISSFTHRGNQATLPRPRPAERAIDRFRTVTPAGCDITGEVLPGERSDCLLANVFATGGREAALFTFGFPDLTDVAWVKDVAASIRPPRKK